jgi:hypothetical protein
MATHYVEPAEGFKALSVSSITDIYTKSLQLIYPAARDIAKELDSYASGFAKSAKARIDELVVIAQNLKWEKERLEREAEAAREGTAEAVVTIHRFLTASDLEDLRNYRKGDEDKAEAAVDPAAQTPPDSPSESRDSRPDTPPPAMD